MEEEGSEGPSPEDRSGFGDLTSRKSYVAPPKYRVHPGKGGQVGEVGSPFMPSSGPRDIVL